MAETTASPRHRGDDPRRRSAAVIVGLPHQILSSVEGGVGNPAPGARGGGPHGCWLPSTARGCFKRQKAADRFRALRSPPPTEGLTDRTVRTWHLFHAIGSRLAWPARRARQRLGPPLHGFLGPHLRPAGLADRAGNCSCVATSSRTRPGWTPSRRAFRGCPTSVGTAPLSLKDVDAGVNRWPLLLLSWLLSAAAGRTDASARPDRACGVTGLSLPRRSVTRCAARSAAARPRTGSRAESATPTGLLPAARSGWHTPTRPTRAKPSRSPDFICRLSG
jgi:hypothetical protein